MILISIFLVIRFCFEIGREVMHSRSHNERVETIVQGGLD